MIPKNPITIAINKGLTDKALGVLNNLYLPSYDLKITSQYRDQAKNTSIGGSEDSAHMYGLAADFVLVNKVTGKIVSDSQMASVHKRFIKPYWKGYTYFKPKQPNTNTGWIHANLDREISKATMWAGVAAVAGGGLFFLNKFRKNLKLKRA